MRRLVAWHFTGNDMRADVDKNGNGQQEPDSLDIQATVQQRIT